MFCPKCGKNVGNSVFCDNCGTQIIDNKDLQNNNKIEYKTNTIGLNNKTNILDILIKFFRTFAIICITLAIILTIANFYFTKVMTSPKDIVLKAITAKNENDIKTFVSCMDSPFQKEFLAAVDLSTGINSNITGMNLDWNKLMDITSAFNNQNNSEIINCNPNNFKTINVKNEKFQNIIDKYNNIAVNNALGSTATVSFDVDNTDKCRTSKAILNEEGRLTYTVTVKKYGNAWLIPAKEFETEIN